MGIREEILAKDDVPRETVEVPEWGVKVEVRGMTALDRAQFLQRVIDTKGQADLTKVGVQAAVVSLFDPETGERIFGPDDADALSTKSAAVVERLAFIALRLSGLTADAVKEAKLDF